MRNQAQYHDNFGEEENFFILFSSRDYISMYIYKRERERVVRQGRE